MVRERVIVECGCDGHGVVVALYAWRNELQAQCSGLTVDCSDFPMGEVVFAPRGSN